jgi:predicted esterase
MNLQYLVREPKQIIDKNPLLLLLHGYGSNEEDLFIKFQVLCSDLAEMLMDNITGE